MAAPQNSLLSRMRSARVPAANSSKSLAPTSSSGASHAHTALTVSNISLFLRNLRLLDLDLLPDWPDINALTFTNKDAAQGQKKRIQCVEWALFQLFALWNPDDARNKLQPFFPPMDQLQSTNLRSALLRSLDQVKKNGFLGRDIVLRKTMLDECKGERLEEILAVFSSAVLRKIVAEGPAAIKSSSCIAQNLALEKRGYSGEPPELTPLILAHRVSLKTRLDQKGTARAQYKVFAKLLDTKEREISHLQEEASAAADQQGAAGLSEDKKTRLRRAIRNNWTGNEKWMDTVLYGDAKSRQDGLLSAPFDRVWRRVQTGRLGELEDENTGGLLEQLDGRVRMHQARLEKWQKFRKEMFDDVSAASETDRVDRVGEQKGIDLGFGVHEALQLGQISPRKLGGVSTPSHGEYGKLLDGFQKELKLVNQAPTTQPFTRLRARLQNDNAPTNQASSDDKAIEELLSEFSELEEELGPAVPVRRPPTQRALDGATPFDAASTQAKGRARPKLPQPLSSNHVLWPKTRSTEISPIEDSTPRVPSPRRSPVRKKHSNFRSPAHSPIRSPPPSPQRQTPSPIVRTQSPEPLPRSPTQQQADQILASMSAASPSPVKKSNPRHTLSLAERTRLSMARVAPIDVEEEGDMAMGSPSPTRSWRRNTSRSPIKKKPDTPNTMPESASPAEPESAGENDLAARTRRSMANFEAAQQRARLDKQRSLRRAARENSGSLARQSYFPSAVEGEGASEDTTVVLEELIAKEAEGVDYESVFKSRPKIKTSPPSTPARGGVMEFD